MPVRAAAAQPPQCYVVIFLWQSPCPDCTRWLHIKGRGKVYLQIRIFYFQLGLQWISLAFWVDCFWVLQKMAGSSTLPQVPNPTPEAFASVDIPTKQGSQRERDASSSPNSIHSNLQVVWKWPASLPVLHPCPFSVHHLCWLTLMEA